MSYLFMFTACLAGHTAAQNSSSNPFTIAFWTEPRAAIVRDTLYIDGGFLNVFDSPQNDPSSYNEYNNSNHAIFQFSLSKSFSTSAATSLNLFDLEPKSIGSQVPSYTQSGMMFANNDQLYLYGGLFPQTAAENYVPPPNEVQNYRRYTSDTSTSLIANGWYLEDTTNGVINNITNGAGANAPSENMGYYFSGMHAPAWGPISLDSFPPEATVPSTTLITVNMATEGRASWSNLTIDPSITPRSNGQLVWLPYSTQGLLLSIGGVQYASDVYSNTNNSINEGNSSTFTSIIPVYDVASNRWYQQNTSGTGVGAQSPGQLAGFCSVVASAKDNSSHSIYVYGGYDGVNSSASDDVWILSIPSFVWVKVYSSPDSTHGRSGHVCVKPYPNQMMVVGGTYDNGPVKDSILQIFNLNNNSFQPMYDPTSFDSYQVPSAVVAAIGGSPTGGATQTAPDSSWATSDLASLFSAKYSGTLPTYFPYSPVSTPTPTTTHTSTPNNNKWLGPVVGVIGALVLISLLLGIYLIFRRQRRRQDSVTSTQTPGNQNRISRWLNGTPHPTAFPKSDASIATTEVEETSGSAELGGTPRYSYYSPVTRRTEQYNGESSHLVPVAEVAGDHAAERYEMHNMSAPAPAPASELPTSYHFQNHPSYPRSIDYAFNSPSEPQYNRDGPSSYGAAPSSDNLHHNRDVLMARSNAGDPSSFHDQTTLSASPPLTQGTQPPTPSTSGPITPATAGAKDKHISGESGPSALTSRPSVHRRNLSSLSSDIPTLSPTNATIATSPNLSSTHDQQQHEPAPPDVSPDLGSQAQLHHRPSHKRNMSSMSSGVVLSPVETTTDGELGREREQERFFAGLPQKGDVVGQEEGLTEPLVARGTSDVEVRRRQVAPDPGGS